MTHLYIELNTGLTEEVNSSIISKLYELAISGDLDETSNLKGRLHTSLGSKHKVDYLIDSFDDLHISVDTYTIDFEDTNVESIVVSKIGVDNAVTQSAIEAVTYIGPTWFRNDTTIVKFNEFRYFTGLGRNGNACNQMFLNCSNLKEVTIPSNLEYIYSEMFGSCSSLESITIPNSVHEVINQGFTMCTALKSLTFTGLTGVCSLGQKLNALESLTLNEGCTSLILTNTQTYNLTSLTLPASITSLNISNMKGILTVTFDSNSTSIAFPGYGGFNGCSSLVTINNFPQRYTLSNHTFCGCSNLTTLIQPPSGITEIPFLLYDSCSSLSGTLIIPDTVTNIGRKAFLGCRGLTFKCLPTTPPTIEESSFLMSNGADKWTSGGYIYVPDNSVEDYKAATYWSNFASKIKPISEYPT